ncbi:glycosyltransferase [Noviherbaspirillum sp. CPCC 100848]|uniref:Glycosyltransferase n=1 Tax=Noviherbaspirillum album TaxID=3080276 RepID=A0ABU6J7L4_9BURK|nr:glycosyltransferase [Noviherbaspirillum sp. CPCC 100848]MEC4719277.1 glycosyltransferase [Noviherbaspirillum sp. CPCC 100848]
MSSFLISFIVSVLLTLFIIKHARRHPALLDYDLDSVQKVHPRAVPRIGGAGIFIAVIITAAIAMLRTPHIGQGILMLLVCSSVAFAGGFVEDLTKNVSPARRLLLTMLAAVMGFYLLGARIERIDWFSSSWHFNVVWLALPLTVLAVAGIANAVNIIDGFNGLATVVSISMLLSLGYVALQVNDTFIVVAALVVAGAAAGFLIWNYPAGLIFLGDGGAYFLGFMLGELSILLVMRNPEVSTWYAVLLLIYPVFETLFSAYRRLFLRGQSPGAPDGIHLHSLIFRRVVVWAVGRRDARALNLRNAMTSPYLWMLSLMAVVPATLFWRHTWILIGLTLLFVVSYVWLYARIVRFRSPRWMIMQGKKSPHGKKSGSKDDPRHD